MGYYSLKKQKETQIYKLNNVVQETPENKKKIKQDYETVKNHVMESNAKVVDIQDTKQKRNIMLLKCPLFSLLYIIYIWLKL